MRILRDVLAGNTSFLSRVPGSILEGTLVVFGHFSNNKAFFMEILRLIYSFTNFVGIDRKNKTKIKVAFSL